MGKILIAYDSGYGATADAAKIIGDALTARGWQADIHLVEQGNPAGYNALAVGSPIRYGRCTPKIKRFIKANLAVFSQTPTAFFFTCMSVTGFEPLPGMPLYFDPAFNDPNQPSARLPVMEKSHTASHYQRGLARLIPGVTPVDMGIFRGRLDMDKLNLWHRLMMRFVMLAMPGVRSEDFFNPAVIADWADRLADRLDASKSG
jgi:menaquinone-dependent protoporphyrinogen IX oxidase